MTQQIPEVLKYGQTRFRLRTPSTEDSRLGVELVIEPDCRRQMGIMIDGAEHVVLYDDLRDVERPGNHQYLVLARTRAELVKPSEILSGLDHHIFSAEGTGSYVSTDTTHVAAFSANPHFQQLFQGDADGGRWQTERTLWFPALGLSVVQAEPRVSSRDVSYEAARALDPLVNPR